jgi:uncharacterized membrane protein YbhN (UPF0104 family)
VKFKQYLISGLKIAISLGLGVGLIVFMINKLSPADKAGIIDAFKRANYFWVFLAPLLGVLSNFSRAQRWRQLLKPLGYYPSFANTFFSIMLMYFFNLFVPRLGEVTRCSILARYEKIPLDKSIGTMVVERLADLVAILIIGAGLFAIEHQRLYAFFEKALNGTNEPNPNAAPAYLKWVVIGGIAIVAIGFAIYILRKHGFEELKKTITNKMLGFIDGLKSIRYVERPWEFILHSIAIWLCYFLMIYLSFRALPETADLSVFAGAACLFFGGFAMVLTPGGIGAYPLAIQGVLMAYGITEVIGLALGNLVWAAQMGSVLVGGLISLVLLAIINKEPSLKEGATG